MGNDRKSYILKVEELLDKGTKSLSLKDLYALLQFRMRERGEEL